jgi:hypothetical protein
MSDSLSFLDAVAAMQAGATIARADKICDLNFTVLHTAPDPNTGTVIIWMRPNYYPPEAATPWTPCAPIATSEGATTMAKTEAVAADTGTIDTTNYPLSDVGWVTVTVQADGTVANGPDGINVLMNTLYSPVGTKAAADGWPVGKYLIYVWDAGTSAYRMELHEGGVVAATWYSGDQIPAEWQCETWHTVA